MSDAEIQASIESVLMDSTKTPLYSLLGLNEVDYRWQATKMVLSAIATYEPRAVVTGVEFNGGLRVRWQPVTADIRSETYPDTSAMTPQDAAEYLLEYALAGFLGKNKLSGIEDAVREAINSDSRLKILTTDFRSEGSRAEINVQVLSLVPLVKILKYDGISQYDGTWSYG